MTERQWRGACRGLTVIGLLLTMWVMATLVVYAVGWWVAPAFPYTEVPNQIQDLANRRALAVFFGFFVASVSGIIVQHHIHKEPS